MEAYAKLRVAVTGGAGFIGSHLVEKLLDLGAEVTVIDNFRYGSKIEHLRKHKNLFICPGDVRHVPGLAGFLLGKNIVFHLAACVGVEETQKDPLLMLDVGILGTANVLQAAVTGVLKKIVIASSSEAYGDSSEPMKEEGPLYPKSAYAVTKLAAEEYVKAFHQKRGLDYTCLRYFNVYGPYQDDRFVITRFVNNILADEPIKIYGDGSQRRDFTYIDDAVDMTLLAGIKPEANYQAINIGTGVSVSINEVARLVAKALDSKDPPKIENVDYDAKRPREIEVYNRCADTTKATKLLGYKAQTTLEAGIKKYVAWRLERQNLPH